jgi:hypothetical protein
VEAPAVQAHEARKGDQRCGIDLHHVGPVVECGQAGGAVQQIEAVQIVVGDQALAALDYGLLDVMLDLFGPDQIDGLAQQPHPFAGTPRRAEGGAGPGAPLGLIQGQGRLRHATSLDGRASRRG